MALISALNYAPLICVLTGSLISKRSRFVIKIALRLADSLSCFSPAAPIKNDIVATKSLDPL